MCSIKQDTNITLQAGRGGRYCKVGAECVGDGKWCGCTVYCVLCTQGMTKHAPVVPIVTPAHNAAATSSQAPGSSAR